MVARGLASGVRRIRTVRRRLGEKTALTQSPVDFVSRDMVKAECQLSLAFKILPIRPSCLEQYVSADDIGLDKLPRAINGTVDMRLCS